MKKSVLYKKNILLSHLLSHLFRPFRNKKKIEAKNFLSKKKKFALFVRLCSSSQVKKKFRIENAHLIKHHFQSDIIKPLCLITNKSNPRDFYFKVFNLKIK